MSQGIPAHLRCFIKTCYVSSQSLLKENKDTHRVFYVCVTLAVWAGPADGRWGMLTDYCTAVPTSRTHRAAAASDTINTQHTTSDDDRTVSHNVSGTVFKLSSETLQPFTWSLAPVHSQWYTQDFNWQAPLPLHSTLPSLFPLVFPF